MRISDWSSDVCSSDLEANCVIGEAVTVGDGTVIGPNASLAYCQVGRACQIHAGARIGTRGFGFSMDPEGFVDVPQLGRVIVGDGVRSEEHTSELQSLMRISYAVFCLKKKKQM